MAARQPLSRAAVTSLGAQADQNFQQQILEARLRPGRFVSQREPMQGLGMPRRAVREPIPQREAEGLLHTAPRRCLPRPPLPEPEED